MSHLDDVGDGQIRYESAAIDPINLARDLIESLRLRANLDYRTCQECAELVVQQLFRAYNVEQLAPLLSALKTDVLDVTLSSDTVFLKDCLSKLSAVKADAQQRSWALHDDGQEISSILAIFCDAMVKADQRVVLYAVADDDYERLHDLVEFYQMETRTFIRIAQLKAFLTVLSFDPKLVTILLTTVLPVEIARDILNDKVRVPEKFQLSLQVLTRLFSTGEQIPLQYYDVLDSQFVSLLLEVIEDSSQKPEIVDDALACLIAFGIHFPTVDDNLIISQLRHRADKANKLTELLLLLFNRKTDPVWLYPGKQCPYASSVLKFLENLFSDQDTQRLFYANDISVLVEIVLRELCNLPPEMLRTEYLLFLKDFVTNARQLLSESQLAEISSVAKQLIQNSTDDGSTDVDKQYLSEIDLLIS